MIKKWKGFHVESPAGRTSLCSVQKALVFVLVRLKTNNLPSKDSTYLASKDAIPFPIPPRPIKPTCRSMPTGSETKQVQMLFYKMCIDLSVFDIAIEVRFTISKMRFRRLGFVSLFFARSAARQREQVKEGRLEEILRLPSRGFFLIRQCKRCQLFLKDYSTLQLSVRKRRTLMVLQQTPVPYCQHCL